MNGFNIVIVYKNNVDVENLTYAEVEKDLCKCLKKADIFTENVD